MLTRTVKVTVTLVCGLLFFSFPLFWPVFVLVGHRGGRGDEWVKPAKLQTLDALLTDSRVFNYFKNH